MNLHNDIPGQEAGNITLFAFFYHIDIGAEVALVATVFIITGTLETGRQHDAGHERAAGSSHFLYTVRHGVQSVSRAKHKAVGIHLHGLLH